MVCRMTKRNDNNVVPVEEFWQRKVDKLNTLHDYGVISKDEYVEGLVRLGFKLKDVLESLEEENNDEEQFQDSHVSYYIYGIVRLFSTSYGTSVQWTQCN